MDDASIDWAGAIRRYHEGTMLFAGVAAHLSFVIDGATGRLVMPAARLAIESGAAVLFVPEEREGALELMVEGEQIDPEREWGAACDRWTAYHGRATERFWGAFGVEGAKLGREVAETDSLDLRSPLVECEGRLCRLANADRSAMAAACRDLCGVEVVDPLCVGVDDRGMDVRARFGILRLEFGRRAVNEEAARAELAGLLRSGGAS